MSGLNLRVVGEAMGRSNPLIAALIDLLPPTSGGWPAADREAWLQMMSQAFTVAYGSEPGARPMRTNATPAAAAPARKRPSRSRPKSKRRPAPAAPPKAPAPPPEFYIDAQGYARNGAGETILPEDVNDILYDRRGENGDLGSIIWADGSRGIPKGLRLDISAAA